MRLCYVLFNDFYITFITLVNTNVQSAAIYSHGKPHAIASAIKLALKYLIFITAWALR